MRGRSRGAVRRPKILIICEGENTEVDYFNALIVLFKLNQTVKAQKVTDVKSANKKCAFKVAEKSQASAEEFWYLLHHTYTTRPFASYDEIVPTLKKVCPDYSKKGSESKRLAKQFVMNEAGRTQAIQHAKNVRNHHRSQGDSPRSMPSTEVDRLVVYLDGMRVKQEKTA